MSVDTLPDEDDFFAYHDRRPRKRWPVIALGVGLVVLLIAGIGAVWVNNRINPPGPPGAEVEVVVTPGMSTSSVGKMLQEKGVIKSATVFSWYARFKGAGSVKAGNYTLRKNDELGHILDALEQGAKPRTDRMTIPEGLTLEQIADRVGQVPGHSKDRFLAVAGDGSVRSQFQPPATSNLEGLLLPETYYIEPGDDEQDILSRMVGGMDQAAKDLDIVNGSARLGISPYQVIIVASLIEEEAKVDEDRGPIARVIYNRLAQKMPLGIDATILYAQDRVGGKVLYRDLEVASPYNTYKVTGLPPTPIASPGRKSLEAALNPPPGTWLYYVLSDANGKHAFATSAAEFERLKAQAQAKGLL